MKHRTMFWLTLLWLPSLLRGQTSSPTVAVLTVPTGSVFPLVNTRPVWAASTKPGDPLYMETVAPVVAAGRAIVPPGTYVLASVVDLLKPTRKVNQAQFTLRMERMILPGGTTLSFPENSLARVSVQVSVSNDLLLDNGTQLVVSTVAPFALPEAVVARSLMLATAPALTNFRTATNCRYIPGSPGSPGSPGTPDTVIKGQPATPDTVIPNGDGPPTIIPGSPGTPDVTIPGTPATPDTPDTPPTYCPDPPLVTASVPEAVAAPLAFDPPPPKPVKQKKPKKT